MQVAVGDVIYIEANSGAVKRVGRSDVFATEFDLEAEEYVPLPKGEVHKKKEIVQVCIYAAQYHLLIYKKWALLPLITLLKFWFALKNPGISIITMALSLRCT